MFHTTLQKTFFAILGITHWNRLPSGVVRAPSNDCFKFRLGKASNILSLFCPDQRQLTVLNNQQSSLFALLKSNYVG